MIIWDLTSRDSTKIIRKYENQTPGAQVPIQTAVLHPNQATIIFGDGSGCIRLWDLSKGEVVPGVELNPVMDVGIQSLCVVSLQGYDFLLPRMNITFIYILTLVSHATANI